MTSTNGNGVGTNGARSGSATHDDGSPPADRAARERLRRDQRERLRRRLIVGGGALIAINLGIIGVVSTVTDEPDSGRPPVVETIIPGTQVPPQGPVGIDLTDGVLWSVDLAFDGTPLPNDQYSVNEGAAQFVFFPGPGQEFSSFSPGRHVVTATFVSKSDEAVGTPPTVYEWQINVG